MSNFEDLLRPYYSRIFPYEPYIKWLNGGSVTQSDSLSKREFSFTLQDDIYLRYLSFSSVSEQKTATGYFTSGFASLEVALRLGMPMVSRRD